MHPKSFVSNFWGAVHAPTGFFVSLYIHFMGRDYDPIKLLTLSP